MQVLHNGQGHWLTISTIEVVSPAVVNVYDSKYSSASRDLKMQIASLLHTDHSVITLLYQDVQKQHGGSDCGLFAIAYATALVHGFQPEECYFSQATMRSHLLRCFEEKKMLMFPLLRKRRKRHQVKTDYIKVFCFC